MHWSILTPDGSLHWDGESCRPGPPATRADAPDGDALERLWRTYYGAIFNPARTNLRAMTREMPKRHWDLLPEAQDVAALVAAAPERTSAMVQSRSEGTSARPFVPDSSSLERLAEAAQTCRGCDLYRDATRAVFGEGRRAARIVLVGEQPGDEEERKGAPFVGPAGRVLDEALEAAGVDRGDGLRHQRGQAFQVRAARQVAHPQEARGGRGTGLPALARIRAPQRRNRGSSCASAQPRRSRCSARRLASARRPRRWPHPGRASTLVTYHPSAVLRARDESRARDAGAAGPRSCAGARTCCRRLVAPAPRSHGSTDRTGGDG